jgi:hypothetical protein
MEDEMASEREPRQGETEYQSAEIEVAGAEGFEPSALGFGDWGGAFGRV